MAFILGTLCMGLPPKIAENTVKLFSILTNKYILHQKSKMLIHKKIRKNLFYSIIYFLCQHSLCDRMVMLIQKPQVTRAHVEILEHTAMMAMTILAGSSCYSCSNNHLPAHYNTIYDYSIELKTVAPTF